MFLSAQKSLVYQCHLVRSGRCFLPVIKFGSEGNFGYVQGPGNATMLLGKLEIPRTYGLQFCFFSTSLGTKFEVVLQTTDTMDNIMSAI